MYWITGLLGVASIVAPFLFGFNNNNAAFWTSLGVGAVLVVVSILEGLAQDRDTWEYWVAAVFGVVAIIAPFILGFTNVAVALWTVLAIGALTIIASGYRLLTKAST